MMTSSHPKWSDWGRIGMDPAHYAWNRLWKMTKSPKYLILARCLILLSFDPNSIPSIKMMTFCDLVNDILLLQVDIDSPF